MMQDFVLYCYLPLYIFCEDQLLCARLRTADRDASDGVLTEQTFFLVHFFSCVFETL